MARPTITFPFNVNPATGLVTPISAGTEWIDVFSDVSTADPVNSDGVIQNPGLISDERPLLDRATSLVGTTIRVRLRYGALDTAQPVSLRIRMFGSNNGDSFAAIRNLNGDASVLVPTVPAEDTIYSGDKVTIPDNDAHSWDCDGYTYFMIGIEREYTGASAATSIIQAKIV